MIYIRKLFTQDLRDGKQIAFPKDPSLKFFNFNYLNNEEDRNIEFSYKADFSQTNLFDGKIIQTRLYAAGSESRIDGQLKAFLRDELVVSVEDFVVFFNVGKSFDKFVVKVVKQTDPLHAFFLRLTNAENHTIILDDDLLQETDLKPHQIPNTGCKNRILFGAPGTGKSHKLEEDCKTYFCDSNEILENYLIEEIKNRPQDKDKEPWFNHIGMKYASFVYKMVNENTEEALQSRFGISQNELWKMKTAAKASIDYAHVINNGVEEIGKRYERVTFHPNYSYAQFVGTYKPVQNSEKGKESEILYKYVEGPFMRVLVNSLKHPESNFLLIIEEINRANVAAVFGDVFQLLDRKDGVSEYPVAASEDIKRYLKDNGIADCNELKIPSNMYIWATMNSADQGVFPMDTAFKRRWEFEYIGVDDNQQKIENFEIPMQEKKDAEGNVTHEWMKWNDLRTKINDKLTELGINEDKLLGPFFISLEKLKSVDNHDESEAENFVKAFKSKVLMYLFEDALKMKAPSFFKCDKMRYSEICKKFDTDGIEVFNF